MLSWALAGSPVPLTGGGGGGAGLAPSEPPGGRLGGHGGQRAAEEQSWGGGERQMAPWSSEGVWELWEYWGVGVGVCAVAGPTLQPAPGHLMENVINIRVKSI